MSTAAKIIEGGLVGEGEQNAASQTLTQTSSRTHVTGQIPNETDRDELTRVGTDDEKEKESIHDAPREPRPEEAAYMSGLPLYLTFIGLLLSVFLFALDQSIVATAIPRFVSEFEAFEQVSWVITGYFLTQCSLILIAGQLLTMIKAKWVLLAALFFFELGSLVAGVSKSMNVMILGRAIQGVGVSAMFSSIMLIIVMIVRIEQRAAFMSSFGLVFVLSSVCGPILGGAFTDKVSWRWCFYINLPVGAISAAVVFWYLPATAPQQIGGVPDERPFWRKFVSLDWIGTVLLFGIITCLLLALAWGGNDYEWSNWRIIFLFILGGVLIIVFAAWEYKINGKGLIPRIIISNRTELAVCIAIFATMTYFLGGVFQLPLYYQAVRGESPTKSGISIIPFMLSACIGIFISGGVVAATGRYYYFIIAGPIIAVIGNALLYTIDAHTSNPKLIGYQILAGFGCGLAFQNIILSVQAEWHERPEYMAQAIGVSNFFQLTGAALGLGIVNTVQSIFLNRELRVAAPGDLFAKVRNSVTAIYEVDAQYRPAIIDAYVKAITKSFIPLFISVAIAFVASIFIRNHNMKTKGGAGGAMAA